MKSPLIGDNISKRYPKVSLSLSFVFFVRQSFVGIWAKQSGIQQISYQSASIEGIVRILQWTKMNNNSYVSFELCQYFLPFRCFGSQGWGKERKVEFVVCHQDLLKSFLCHVIAQCGAQNFDVTDSFQSQIPPQFRYLRYGRGKQNLLTNGLFACKSCSYLPLMAFCFR